MRLLDALIRGILDIRQMHWTQTHQTHFRTTLGDFSLGGLEAFVLSPLHLLCYGMSCRCRDIQLAFVNQRSDPDHLKAGVSHHRRC